MGFASAQPILERSLPSSLVKQRIDNVVLAPDFGSGVGVCPSSALLPSPNARGGAPRSACPGFRQSGPGLTGRTTRTGPGRIMRDAIQRSNSAPRGIAPLIAFTAAGPAGPLLPRQAF